ncbi:MAG: glycerol-3-phosphate 1-O-acyltransferase PlsY [Cellulosilyticum sp.]|nr:glycerol-3-phosphate 1-O-acyltransferase PlsY [Cellulosilyticum sp.]
MYRIGALLIGYLLGGVQSAILVGRFKGIDIRTHGSGNAGTTNTIRVLGKKAGALVLVIDILKAVIAIVLAKLIFGSSHQDAKVLIALYSGIGAILGHSYPLWFGFKGGKGIATTAGTLIGIDVRLFLIAAAVFLICFCITRIVSISSLLMTASLPVLISVMYAGKGAIGIEAMLLALAITAFTFYRHKANIIRIMNGTEAKLTSKK